MRHACAALIAAATAIALTTPASSKTFVPDKAKVEAGEEIYANNCFTCHGENLVSTGQTFDLRRLRADERPRFDRSVRKGKKQMPPWEGVLSDKEIDALWHFIRAHANDAQK